MELVVESLPWEIKEVVVEPEKKPAPTDRFGVRIGYLETELRDKAKQMGGIWRPQHKLWELSYAQITALGIQDRIVAEG